VTDHPGDIDAVARAGDARRARPTASIIIPAYDEESVIGRCLDALSPFARGDARPRVQVVVAANGCRDRTVDIARSYDGVDVLDIPTGSKTLALNEGDAAAESDVRVYLDADIELSSDAVPALVDALSVEAAVVAAPRIRFDLEASSVAVRAFYRVFAELPYVKNHLVGLGVYGLSSAGRARFDRFPDLVADDLYVQRLFAPEERRTTAGTFTVAAPRTLRSLLDVRVRVAKGNAGLAGHGRSDDDDRFASSTGSTSRALLDLARRRPGLVPSIAVYLGVTLAARAIASRRTSDPHATWERDESTRP